MCFLIIKKHFFFGKKLTNKTIFKLIFFFFLKLKSPNLTSIEVKKEESLKLKKLIF